MWEREWADPSSSQCPKPAEPDTSSPFLGCSSFSLPSFFPPSYTYLLATLDSRSRTLTVDTSSPFLATRHPPFPLPPSYTCLLQTLDSRSRNLSPFLGCPSSSLPHSYTCLLVNFGQQEQEPDTDLPPVLAASHPLSHTLVQWRLWYKFSWLLFHLACCKFFNMTFLALQSCETRALSKVQPNPLFSVLISWTSRRAQFPLKRIKVYYVALTKVLHVNRCGGCMWRRELSQRLNPAFRHCLIFITPIISHVCGMVCNTWYGMYIVHHPHNTQTLLTRDHSPSVHIISPHRK